MTDKKDGLAFEGEPRITPPEGMNTITIQREGWTVDVPECIWMPAGWEVLDGTIPVDRQAEDDDVQYIRHDLHLAAVKAARIEGYEIARKEAAECGWHLRRADLVEALNG